MSCSSPMMPTAKLVTETAKHTEFISHRQVFMSHKMVHLLPGRQRNLLIVCREFIPGLISSSSELGQTHNDLGRFCDTTLLTPTDDLYQRTTSLLIWAHHCCQVRIAACQADSEYYKTSPNSSCYTSIEVFPVNPRIHPTFREGNLGFTADITNSWSE